MFCWDNNDIAEETKLGGRTTHCPNGNIVQRQTARPIGSLTATKEPSSAPVKVSIEYHAGQRHGPIPFAIVRSNATRLMSDKVSFFDRLPKLKLRTFNTRINRRQRLGK